MRSTQATKKQAEDGDPNNKIQPKSSTVHIVSRFAVRRTLPLKHRSFSTFDKISANLSKSFHDIHKVKKQLPGKNKHSFYFLKQKKDNPVDTYMYQLEAAANEICYFFAPSHTSKSHVLHDNANRDIGIVSKNLIGFRPALDDPLKKEDLEIPAIKHCTIEDLEEIDIRAQEENYTLDDKPLDHQICPIIKQGPNDTIKEIVITVRDLKNYRIVKGNGIGLTMNYILANADCHRCNISKDGKMIDFDMWLWEIFYDFKQGGIDLSFRKQYENFIITTNDIENFPDIKDASFFYWCTIPVRIIPERFRSIVSLFFNISKNAFQPEENEVYKELKNNPVFIYHKFANLLKFCLAEKEIIHGLLSLHIRNNLYSQGKNLTEIITAYVENRRLQLLEALYQSPSFKQFMQEHGDTVIKQIVLDFAKHNHKYIEKSKTEEVFSKEVINLSDVLDRYASIGAKIGIGKYQDDLKLSPEIKDEMEQNQQYFENNSNRKFKI